MRRVVKDPWPLIIFGIALSIRLFYLSEIKDHPFFTNPQLDSQHYDDWAWGIAQGNWIGGDKAYWASPFYAYFLAIIYRIFGHNYVVVGVLQVFLGSVTWMATYWIGEELFSKRVGIIAALIGAFYSYSIFMDGELLKNSLAAFTTTLAILLVLKAKKKDSSALWLISGLNLGLTVLSQPNVLLFIPLFISWGVDWKRRGRRDIVSICAFIFGAAFIISPATIRNYIVEKDFVLVTYNGGINFFQGNNIESDGGALTSKLYKLIPQREEERTRGVPEKSLGRKLKSSEISKYWFFLGKRFIYENPKTFVRLTFKKFLLFWNWYEVPNNVDYYFVKRSSTVLSLPLISFGIISPFVIVGLFLSLGNWRGHLLSYGIVLIFMFTLVLFYIIGRFRLPIVPFLCVYAAFSIERLYAYFKERDYKKTFIVIIAIILMGVVANLNILKYPPEHSQKILGNIYMKNEMYRDAVAEYKNALKAFPFDGPLRLSYASSLEKAGFKADALEEYRRLLSFDLDLATKAKINSVIGSILLGNNDRKGAEKAYEEALHLDDTQAEALNNLAWLYLDDGKRLKDARKYAEKALKIEPASPEYMDTLGMVLLKEGKKSRAIKIFKEALEIKPDSAELRGHLKEAVNK